jgi:hypothetical protein
MPSTGRHNENSKIIAGNLLIAGTKKQKKENMRKIMLDQTTYIHIGSSRK